MGRSHLRADPTSDLDLVFVWEAPEGAQSAGNDSGTRSLGATAYFTRLAQTMASWLGGATGEGDLYSIDTRLRPDGDKGSFAPSLARFADYYRGEAWLWERLALAKTRLVTPRASFATALRSAVAEILTLPVPSSQMAAALHDMRGRIRAGYGEAPAWQVRRRAGGIAELDLLVQGLRLVHADLFSGGGQTAADILETPVSLYTSDAADDYLEV